jgi:hypothetical protein
MTLGWLRFHDSKLPPPRMNARHDFSYVLFRAALGAFGVFLIIGIDLDDHILIMLGGVCLGLVLIASYCLDRSSRSRSERKGYGTWRVFDQGERFLKRFNRLL